MDEPSLLDEVSLRDLLVRTTEPEPSIGPIARNALQAGLRVRRRRRVGSTATCAAVIAVACGAALTATGAAGRHTPALAQGPGTIYLLETNVTQPPNTQGTLIPIPPATNKPGEPIVVSSGIQYGVWVYGAQMSVAPDGKTIWVINGDQTVTPVSTRTLTAGKPITVVDEGSEGTAQVLVNPDGQAVYVLDTSGTVTPISTATDRPGTPIKLGQGMGAGEEMAITPDGSTLYVAIFSLPSNGPVADPLSEVIPISTATGTPGPPIHLRDYAHAIVASPDGQTIYVIGDDSKGNNYVTPIPTATNIPGRQVSIGSASDSLAGNPVVTPNGQTLYVPLDDVGRGVSPSGVVPFSTATNTAGKMIDFGTGQINNIAITPNGNTLYVASGPPPQDSNTGSCVHPGSVTPIATATNTPGNSFLVGCVPEDIAITLDGSTAYVVSRSPGLSDIPGGPVAATLTPVATSTNRLGKPVAIQYPGDILIAP